MVGSDDNSVSASSGSKLEAHYKITELVHVLSLEAVHTIHIHSIPFQSECSQPSEPGTFPSSQAPGRGGEGRGGEGRGGEGRGDT